VSVTCIVQARMGSTRLPGKVLADLAGRPMLALLLARLATAAVDHLVVATTDTPIDDAVVDVARAQGADIVRGPEDDVLARFALALDRFPADTVVRITGDCPLADPALVDTAVATREASGADYVSNTLVRTYPDGLDVEVIDAGTLRAAAREAVDAVEREHVTPFVYRRPERFALRSFRHPEMHGARRWTVDTRADLDFVRDVVARIGRTDFGWEEVLAFDAAPPHAVLRPAGVDDEAFVLDLRNDPDSVRWSGSGREVDPASHHEWFRALLDVPASRIWIAHDDGRPAATVRVDVRTGAGP
jgi:spore coat polysaccharide biosynthesis protein SpsF (cytidylyltransferase family)